MTDSQRPAVTVVVPTRDRPSWLRRAVQVARRQRDVELHIVVVNDHSCDADAVARACDADAQVELLIAGDGERGVSAARNLGLARVSTPYVAFLDDDDVWDPGWLAAATAALRASGADLVFGPVALLDGHGRPVGFEPRGDPARACEDLRRDNVVGVPSQVVMSTDMVRDTGGWDRRFSALADWELWLRLRGARLAAVDDVLVGYTLHPAAMHLRDPDAVLAEFRLLREVTGIEELAELRFRRWMAHECARFGRRSDARRLYRDLALAERRPSDAARAARLVFPPRPRRAPRPPVSQDWWPAAERLSAIARADLPALERSRA